MSEEFSPQQTQPEGNTLPNIDDVEQCLKNMFQVPSQRIESAFSLVIELIRNQTAEHQKTESSLRHAMEDYKSKVDDLSEMLENQAQQQRKFSIEHIKLKVAHEKSLMDIETLKEEIKVISYNIHAFDEEETEEKPEIKESILEEVIENVESKTPETKEVELIKTYEVPEIGETNNLKHLMTNQRSSFYPGRNVHPELLKRKKSLSFRASKHKLDPHLTLGFRIDNIQSKQKNFENMMDDAQKMLKEVSMRLENEPKILKENILDITKRLAHMEEFLSGFDHDEDYEVNPTHSDSKVEINIEDKIPEKIKPEDEKLEMDKSKIEIDKSKIEMDKSKREMRKNDESKGSHQPVPTQDLQKTETDPNTITTIIDYLNDQEIKMNSKPKPLITHMRSQRRSTIEMNKNLHAQIKRIRDDLSKMMRRSSVMNLFSDMQNSSDNPIVVQNQSKVEFDMSLFQQHFDETAKDINFIGDKCKNDIDLIRNECKNDIDLIRNECKKDIGLVRDDYINDANLIRDDYKNDIKLVRGIINMLEERLDQTVLKSSLIEIFDLSLSDEENLDISEQDSSNHEYDHVIKSLRGFKVNFEYLIYNLQKDKLSYDDFYREMQNALSKTLVNVDDKLSQQHTDFYTSIEKVYDDIDCCRKYIDTLDSKQNLQGGNYTVDFSEDINTRISMAADKMRESLEESLNGRLDDLKALEAEFERFTHELAEKPNQSQVLDMINDLEGLFSQKFAGSNRALAKLMENLKSELTMKMSKSDVFATVKKLLENAKKEIQQTKNTLMLGRRPYRCLGCDESFPGVHNSIAPTVNHKALPCRPSSYLSIQGKAGRLMPLYRGRSRSYGSHGKPKTYDARIRLLRRSSTGSMGSIGYDPKSARSKSRIYKVSY